MATIRIPIDLKNPRVTSLAGNSFFTVIGLTAWDAGHWEFVKDVDGKIYGAAIVDLQGGAFSSAQVRLIQAWNATTGVSRMSMGYDSPADGASLNPASLTAIAAQDITVPATARLRKDVVFTGLTGLAQDDLVIFEFFHEGAHLNDTVAVNTELFDAVMEITTT
ncbi:hypothetical protein EPN95_04585 [Patescibacteria group bacterium]|nr:MAG: hypothetical protein EPN95_04585 [Patescibacteria group bacterium]